MNDQMVETLKLEDSVIANYNLIIGAILKVKSTNKLCFRGISYT